MDRKEYQKKYKKEYKKIAKQCNISLTIEEYNYFKNIADKQNKSVPFIVKNMALAQLGKTNLQPKKKQEDLKELIFIIRNIANNLNQIARHSNTVKTVLSENKVFSYIKDMEKNIKDFVNNR